MLRSSWSACVYWTKVDSKNIFDLTKEPICTGRIEIKCQTNTFHLKFTERAPLTRNSSNAKPLYLTFKFHSISIKFCCFFSLCPILILFIVLNFVRYRTVNLIELNLSVQIQSLSKNFNSIPQCFFGIYCK